MMIYVLEINIWYHSGYPYSIQHTDECFISPGAAHDQHV